jgi:hypothetical protein
MEYLKTQYRFICFLKENGKPELTAGHNTLKEAKRIWVICLIFMTN